MARGWLFTTILAVAAVKSTAVQWPINPKAPSAPPPQGLPSNDTDCAIRELAYDFGRQVLPRLGDFPELYSALGLDVECDPARRIPSQPHGHSETQQRRLRQAPKDAIWVDPEHGLDTADGSASRPLKTVQAAVDLAAATRPHGATVALLHGVHRLTAPLQLTPRHSGITLTGRHADGPVTISGAVRLNVSWTFVGDDATGLNLYSADVSGQVAQMPTLLLDGAHATRARYPNLPGGLEVSPGYGSMIDGGAAAWTAPDFDKFGNSTYWTDESTQHLRNNTPDDWFQEYMIGYGGLCSVYDPPVSYWCSEDPSGGGAFPFRTPSGVAANKSVLPNSPYQDTSQAVLNVWRPNRWANWMFAVGDFDQSTNNFTFGHGGFQGARGNDEGGDFFVEGLLEELDWPGEWFFNESTGELLLIYNGTGAPPSELVVEAPVLQTLVSVQGDRWSPVRDVTFDSVTFSGTAPTYMEPHGVPSGGDWALERMAAVFVEGAERFAVSGCTFDRLDGNALMFSKYNRNSSVSDSDFSFIGSTAIVSWGHTNETDGDNWPVAGVDGTDGNHPQGTLVQGCSVREVGLYEKQSSFFMQAKTARTTIQNNVFFNGPRAGVNFNDGFGGGDVLEGNLIFSTCRESGDHGPFNSWDRQPFWTDVREPGTPSMIMQWREITQNFLFDNYSPQENVDNDDGSAYYHTHHNVMVYGAQGMKNDFGGHDNHHHDNIYAFITVAMSVCDMLDGHQDVFVNNTVILTTSSVGSPQCEAPGKTAMANNSYYTPSGELTECGSSLADWQAADPDNEPGSTVDTIPEDSEILAWMAALLGV